MRVYFFLFFLTEEKKNPFSKILGYLWTGLEIQASPEKGKRYHLDLRRIAQFLFPKNKLSWRYFSEVLSSNREIMI